MIPPWLTKDILLILSARGTVSLGYGFLNLVVAIHLTKLGYDIFTTLTIFAASLTTSVVMIMGFTALADRFGRRRILIFLGSLMVISGLIFSFTTNLILLVIATVIGGVGASGGTGGGPGGGPYEAVESALLADKSSDVDRNMIFSVRASLGALLSAGGALTAGLPAFFNFDSLQPLFLLFSVLGVIFILLLLGVKEQRRENLGELHFLPKKSGGVVMRLSSMAAVDGFAIGFLTASPVTLWLVERFGVGLESIGPFFAIQRLIIAFSFIVVARIATRIGSVKAIFYTQAPGAALLFLLPLMPTFELAAALIVTRSFIASMDNPIRQSYVMAIVNKEERASAGGLVEGVSRGVPGGLSPSIAGYAIQYVALSIPFLIAGVTQLTGAALFYLIFRKVKPPEEKTGTRN